MEHPSDNHLFPADADSPGADASNVEPGPAGADGAETAETDVVSRGEFNKVVGQRQAAKEKVRQLTAQVSDLLARLGEGSDAADAADSPDSEPPAAVEPCAGPEVEGLPEPVKTHIRELRGRKEALEHRLADLLTDRELRSAAVRAGAINPDQVVALLRSRVRMAEAPDGRFEARFADEAGQVAMDGETPIRDVRQFVESFLAMPENANLVRPTVLPGSGARQCGAAATPVDSMPLSKAEFLSLPPSQRLAVANRMSRRQRDSLLGRDRADGGGYI